jgi:hypothetical protein
VRQLSIETRRDGDILEKRLDIETETFETETISAENGWIDLRLLFLGAKPDQSYIQNQCDSINR